MDVKGYVTKEEFNLEIELLRDKINVLEKNKADKEIIAEIREQISILGTKITDMKETRLEFKEELDKLNLKIQDNNINNIKIQEQQQQNKQQLLEVKDTIKNLNINLVDLKSTLDNSLWNTFCRLYNKYKSVKIITLICIIVFVTLLISALFFYTSNADYSKKFKDLYTFFRGVFK